MIRRETISDLVAFIAVARERSFTRAAAQLRVSPSALSHTIRKLEERLGVRLLTRTSRSVATTDAGERLLNRVGPQFDEVESELEDLIELRDKPAGTIRISTGEGPVAEILLPALARVLPSHPDLNVEISINNGFVDIVEERFDAGVRLGETLAQDMIAVPISPDLRMAVVGSPAYFVERGRPKSPQDLAEHNCLGLRFRPDGGVAMWDLEKAGRTVNVRVDGQLVVSTVALLHTSARMGLGLAYLMEDQVLGDLASGTLIRVLEDWCPTFSGYHLYYPSRRQQSLAFAVVIDALRYRV